MKELKRKELLLKPTPIQKMESISSELGCNIFVKRDDLLGVGFGGNKLRKLEYLMADAEEKLAKLIVTSGSLQTNHGFLTAVMSAKMGLPCLLVLLIEESGEVPALTGNVLLDDYIGCDVEFVDVSDIMENPELSVAEKDDLSSEKLDRCMAGALPKYCEKYGITMEDVYKISSAGSTPCGIWGYVNCVREIVEQSSISYDYIFCGNGSGGTYGGMLWGAEIFMPETKVIGIAIEEMNPKKPQFILDLIKKSSELAEGSTSLCMDDILVLQNSVNNGYAIPDDETMEIIEKIARTEGFFLDPVYSGKIMNGSLKFIAENLKDSGKNVLILHSGGLPGLYNQNMVTYRNDKSKLVDRWKYDKN